MPSGPQLEIRLAPKAQSKPYTLYHGPTLMAALVVSLEACILKEEHDSM